MKQLVTLSPKNIEWEELETISKPPMVYKYRSWNKSPLHNNLLLKNQLYLSAPSDFEDQMDCKNPTRYDLLTEQETKFWIEKTFRRLHPKYNDDSVRRNVDFYYERNGFKDNAYLERIRASEWNDYNKLAGVLSLTVSPLNEALWMKYGDSHAGIAYGFDTDLLIRSTQIPTGGIVQYVDELPVIHPFHETMDQITIRIFFKTKEWEFEQEYRLRDFTHANRLRTFDDQALKEVVLGKDFDMVQVPEITEILKTKGAHVKLFKISAVDGLLSKSPIQY